MAKNDRLLRVEAPTFVAGAIWRDGKCITAAPILRKHMVGKPPEVVKAWLVARGYKWTWQKLKL